MQAWTLPAEAAATIALVIVAAKTHGRQIRLERERQGVWKVDFGTQNDPRVEALWRQDRRGFWSVFVVALTASWATALLLNLGRETPWWLLVALGWSLAASFIALGAASAFRLTRATKEGVPSDDWQRQARQGSLLWWSLVVVAGGVTVILPFG